jgi:6-phosphofructokinase 1
MSLNLDARVLGVRRGFAGLIACDVVELDRRAVGGIIRQGGTFLGTARCQEFYTEQGRRDALRSLNRMGVEGLVVIGGNGSLTGALQIQRMGFPIVGIPATIDNDVNGTDISVGVDTTLNTILDAVDRIKDTASSHQRAFLIETMGRNSGYLALMSGLAGGAELVLIPEVETTLEQVSDVIEDAYVRGKAHCIIIVAEGWKPGTRSVVDYLKRREEELGFEVRLTVLGHVQRGGSPSAFDRVLATRVGAKAAECLVNGVHGVMVGWVGNECVTTPLEEAVAFQKEISLELRELAAIMEL